MEAITIAPFDYPFPAAINPHLTVVEQASIDWAQRFGLLTEDATQRTHIGQYSQLAAYTMPYTEREYLQIGADWIVWLFLLDDQCDEAGLGRSPERLLAMHNHFLAMFDGALPTADDIPLTHAFSDILQRIIKYMSSDTLRRFKENTELYFAGCRWEAHNRQQGVIPDVATYAAVRSFSGAVYTCIDIIEMADQIKLPFYIHHHMIVKQLLQLTSNLIGCCNDLVSFPKEVKHGDVHNLVVLLQNKYQCSLQEAVDRARAMHDAELTKFIQLVDELPSFGADVDAELARYIAAMQAWICAVPDWSNKVLRYAPDAT